MTSNLVNGLLNSVEKRVNRKHGKNGYKKTVKKVRFVHILRSASVLPPPPPPTLARPPPSHRG